MCRLLNGDHFVSTSMCSTIPRDHGSHTPQWRQTKVTASQTTINLTVLATSPTLVVLCEGVNRSPLDSHHKEPIMKHTFPYNIIIIVNLQMCFLCAWWISVYALHDPPYILLQCARRCCFHCVLLWTDTSDLNSLAPGISYCDFKDTIFNLALLLGIFKSAFDSVLRWMTQGLTDDKSKLVQVMAWCRQATSHCLNQCWPRSPTPYGVTRPQWVNLYYLG